MKYENESDYRLKKHTNIVYFLLDNDEVVYVGQSKTGLDRAFSHRDKVFDEVSYVRCKENELDDCESFYIKKYKPKYNKTPGSSNYSMLKAKKYIRYISQIDDLSIKDLKKIINYLQIEVYTLNSSLYISEDSVFEIIKYIDENNITLRQIKEMK